MTGYLVLWTFGVLLVGWGLGVGLGRRQGREPIVVSSGGRVTNPSNESIDLYVKFTRSGKVERVIIYDTLSEKWGEEQPTVDGGIEELRRRTEKRRGVKFILIGTTPGTLEVPPMPLHARVADAWPDEANVGSLWSVNGHIGGSARTTVAGCDGR